MIDYPALDLLLGGYLDQDWTLSYLDEWAAVDAFVQRESRLAPGICSEMARFLAQCPTEQQLSDELLYEFGCGVAVENLGWTYRDWLQALASRVEQQLGRSRAS